MSLSVGVFSLHWKFWALLLGAVAAVALAGRLLPGKRIRGWLFAGIQVGGLLLIGDIRKGGLLGVALPLACAVFLLGRCLESRPRGRARRWVLIVSVSLPVAVLAVTKYRAAGILLDRIVGVAGLRYEPVAVVGLSFLVFKAIHYLVDVGAGRVTAPEFRSYLAFMAFLPTYLSGPMDRYDRFRSDFDAPAPIDGEAASEAAWRIVVGLFKKYVLAQSLSLFAFTAYSAAELQGASPSALWVGTYAYAFQIYFDFAGYSDLAVGTGRLFGIRVPENFRNPYGARNIIEFWNRWHITLSSWLRDYLFVPIGKFLLKRKRGGGSLRVAVASYLVTFAICGVWHGDGANFLAWGVYHGLGLSVCKWFGEASRSFPASYHRFARETLPGRILATALTFHFVTLGWILFANDLPRAARILVRMFGGG